MALEVMGILTLPICTTLCVQHGLERYGMSSQLRRNSKIAVQHSPRKPVVVVVIVVIIVWRGPTAITIPYPRAKERVGITPAVRVARSFMR